MFAAIAEEASKPVSPGALLCILGAAVALWALFRMR